MTRARQELDDIYLQYVGPIRGFLYRLSGNHHLAEDLTQEVFYRAMRQILTGANIDHVSAWLYRIARNLYLDHVKKLHGGMESLDMMTELGAEFRCSYAQPEVESMRSEQHELIQRVLRCLPENQRTALILRDVEGLSYEEICEAMELSISALKSCLYRARQKFAEIFTAIGGM